VNPRVGVAVVGHGKTASALLDAARGIAPPGSLDDVVAIDAGVGETAGLSAVMCAAITAADRGSGVVVLVDLLGASPCQCAQREGQDHALAVVSGVSLAMLLKLSTLDRGVASLSHVADACADAAHRAVVVSERRDDGDGEGAGRSG
jgi:mannose/fructose-specific phosphotransferase system component IIA